MTRLSFALLLCFPIVAHAQTTASKPSSLIASSEAAPIRAGSSIGSKPGSSSSAVDSAGMTPRIVEPKLIHTIVMKDDGSNQHVHVEGRQRVVVVEMTVNELGQPTDLHIPEPVEDALDVEVLATIGKFRYQPGTLNGKPIAMPVHVHYVVPVGAIY